MPATPIWEYQLRSRYSRSSAVLGPGWEYRGVYGSITLITFLTKNLTIHRVGVCPDTPGTPKQLPLYIKSNSIILSQPAQRAANIGANRLWAERSPTTFLQASARSAAPPLLASPVPTARELFFATPQPVRLTFSTSAYMQNFCIT